MDGFSCEIDRLTPVEWDRIIGDFDDLNLYQTAAFADGLRGERRMSHLLLRRDGIPVAGARVAIIKPPGFPVGIAYLKYGPFWRRAGLPPDESVYRGVVAAAVEEYAARRGHMISISPRPHPLFQRTEEGLLRELGFLVRSRLKRPITFFLVNTGIAEEALRASLSQTWRSNLKRAELNQLDIRFRNPMEALSDFRALHDAMIARKNFTDREPLHLLPQIFGQLPHSCSHIVTAAHDGEIVAGAVIIIAGDVGYYLYGASADAALALRAGYALHWRIARWLTERGVCWYDLGDGFSGLRQFKQGFAGKSGAVLTADEFDAWMSPRARVIGSAIYRARNLVGTLRSCRKWVSKKAAGLGAGLLHRSIG
jgi:hypothetical protein